MTAPDSHINTISSTPWVSQLEHPSADAPRLILVVSQVSEPATLARRILGLTTNRAQPILLLGVAPTSESETDLRRSLVAVEGFVAAQGCSVELKTQWGKGWLERVGSECRSFDQVACYEELDAESSRGKPLSDTLARAVRVPVHDLTDFSHPATARRSVLPQIGAWVGSIALIAGFLVLQGKVVLEMQGWAQSVLLLLTLVPEVGLIAFWNSIMG